MPPPTADQLKRMILFHEKVDKLKRSTFAREMFTRATGVTLGWDERKGESVEIRGPNEESTEAMVLTLRFMMQNNDEISLANMAELYEALPSKSVHKANFLDARRKINAQLDQPTPLRHQTTDPKTKKVVRDEILTNRRVLDLVIYGEKAHLNPEKAEHVRQLRRWAMVSALLDNQFNAAAGNLLDGLFYLQMENSALYEEFTGKKLPVYSPER